MKTSYFLLFFLTFSIFISAQSYNELAVKLDKIELIKKESVGGKLDYEKILSEKGGSGFYLVRRVAYNEKDYAAFLWGLSLKKTGVTSLKEALKLWEEIKGEKPSKPRKNAIKNGFNTPIY